MVKPHAMQKETCMLRRFNCVPAKLQLRLDTICAIKMPKRSMCWMDEVTLELIEEFRNYPELWKVKSSAYFNKYKREEAWKRLMKVKYLQKHSMFCTTISHFRHLKYENNTPVIIIIPFQPLSPAGNSCQVDDSAWSSESRTTESASAEG